MIVKILTEHHLEFLSLMGGGGCRASSESTLVKMTHCWKSHVEAHICLNIKGKYGTFCFHSDTPDKITGDWEVQAWGVELTKAREEGGCGLLVGIYLSMN